MVLVVSTQIGWRTIMGSSTRAHKEFRCCIAAENSAGRLKIAGFWYSVCVLNMSRTGYRVRLTNSIAKKLRPGRTPVLDFAGEQWVVDIKSRYSNQDEYTELGLARKKELTKYKLPRSWSFTVPSCLNVDSDPAFLGFLVLAFLTAVICLPGIGDSLGTAPRVRDVVQAVMQSR